MFNASKLCHGSSTSGPSAALKPSRPMISFNSSMVRVIGCGTAQPQANAGHRRIERRPGGNLGFSPLSEGTFCKGRLDRLLDLVESFAGRRPIGLIDVAQSLLHGLQPAALGAEELDACRLHCRGVARRAESGRRVRKQAVQRCHEVR